MTDARSDFLAWFFPGPTEFYDSRASIERKKARSQGGFRRPLALIYPEGGI
jgi:hypothetical protein